MLLLWLLTFLLAVQAIQLPFNVQIPFFAPKQPQKLPQTPRVAIIGAGAGGSSAAFWIAKARERFGLQNVQVDVYDQASYIGGRSTIVYPYDNSSLPPLELGASIFVPANKNLWRASDEFNLTRRDFDAEEGGTEVGIWDGQQVLLTVGNSWWDTLKILWRYGIYSPKVTNSLVKAIAKSYLSLYAPTTPRWDDIAGLAETLGFSSLVSETTLKYLHSHQVSDKYAYELVEAASRVNYGQNVDEIHALEGAVSMLAEKASGIQGGNFQLFEKFLEYSNATVHLNCKVKSIQPHSDSPRLWTVDSEIGSSTYTAVIIAAPYHSTGVTLPVSLTDAIPEQPYVHLHVTLLATTVPTANPLYFNMPANGKPARMMLTTKNGFRNGGPMPAFNSLSYHGEIRPGEWAVKIFSDHPISDEDLNEYFGEGNVGWVYRKEWDAYPVLPPTTSFPPQRLEKGLFYVNSFELFISTMETETISARNIVDLWLNEEFKGLSLCGRTLSAGENTTHETKLKNNDGGDFVYGFDC